MVARTRVKSFIGDVEVTGSLTKGGVDVALPTDIPTTSNIPIVFLSLFLTLLHMTILRMLLP